MTRSISQIEREQLRRQVDTASGVDGLAGGDWIRRVRKALGMSGAALSERLGGGSRSRAANLERNEREERATLRSMREAAEALGCRFVYGIVPPPGVTVENLIEQQAERRAKQLLNRARGHMALEAQTLSAADAAAELARLKAELMRQPPRDFWDAVD